MRRILVVAVVLVVAAGVAVDACTGVVIVDDDCVVVGGNEDWQRFDAHVWAEAETAEAYGAVYMGYQIRGEFGPRGSYWFEFRKALNSGDGYDWSLGPGDTFGTGQTGNLFLGVTREDVAVYYQMPVLLRLASD